jgi:hypothetical protein
MYKRKTWDGLNFYISFNQNITILLQDNCPIHTAHRVADWFQNHNITVLDWPSVSPDLNPIENMWGSLVRTLQHRQVRPQNRDELLAVITDAWNDLPQDYFRNLCLSMANRLTRVIEANGEMTKY